MQQMLKIIYILLIVLFIIGAVFVYFTNQNRIEYFYEVTLIAALVSLWGFLKKNKVIYLIALPGLFRIFLYFKNEEFTAFLGILHLLATLIPFVVVYLLTKETTRNSERSKS